MESINQPNRKNVWQENLYNGTKWCHRSNWIIRGHATNCGSGHGKLRKRRLHYFVRCYQRLCLPNQTARKGLHSQQSELISGRHYPFWCRNDYHQRVGFKLPLRKTDLLKSISRDALRKFVIKACARDPNQRYQNVAEILGDLRPLTENNGKAQKTDYSENCKVAAIFLLYRNEHQPALNRMMEDCCDSVNVLDVDCKASDFNGFNLDGRGDSLWEC